MRLTGQRLVVAAASIILGSAACAGEDRTSGESAARVSSALTSAAAPLIGPEQCQSRAKLHRCVVPPATLQTSAGPTAVPLRTVLTVTSEGDCSAPGFELELAVAVAGEPVVKFPYSRNKTLTVRRRDGGPIGSVQISDSYPYTSQATFNLNCRMRVTASFNEPDVYSAEEARALVGALERDLAEKTRAKQNLEELAGYATALNFIRSTLNRFWDVLSADELQDLRRNAEGSIGTLSKLAFGCGGNLSDEDLAHIMRTQLAIAALGPASDFDLPDGGRKSLGSYLGEQAVDVRASLERVAQHITRDGGTSYEDDLRRAGQAVVDARAKLELARAQLAPWLN